MRRGVVAGADDVVVAVGVAVVGAGGVVFACG